MSKITATEFQPIYKLLFREIASDESVWKKLYIRDFTTLSDESVSWRRLYLQAKRERALRDRAPRPSRSEPTLPYAVPGHYRPQIPDNPMIPGMIGGEYDLRPGGGGLGFPGLRGPPIRGDPPNHPGLMIDPDYNRNRHPDHGNDHHGKGINNNYQNGCCHLLHASFTQ